MAYEYDTKGVLLEVSSLFSVRCPVPNEKER